MFWSIPAKKFRPLIEALRNDMASAGIKWKGDSETLKSHFHKNKIDPKFDSRYRHFYINRRHSVAVSYTWRGTNLFEIADKAELPVNLSELVWNDVLIVNQFSISSSEQVVGTTDQIYCDCKVWVFLDDDYLGRAWCLAETGQYTREKSNCVITVYGKAELKPGRDFLGSMDAGYKGDLPLIEQYILGKFESKAVFNQAIDRAILRLSPLSLVYQGRFDEALGACEQEIAMLKASESENSAALAKAYSTMGTVLYRLGKLEFAMTVLTRALGLCLESDLELFGEIFNRMGTVFLDQGKYSDALDSMSRSLDFRTRCFGTEHVSVAQTYNNIGIVLEKQGKILEALEAYEKALESKQKSLGLEHVSVAGTYGNMGAVFEKLDDYEKALFYYKKTLEIFKNTLGDSHISVAASETNIGNVLLRRGEYENALLRYQKALDIEIKSLGGDHVSVAATEKNIGDVHLKRGEYDSALLRYQKALDIEIKSFGGAHPSVAATYKSMGCVEDELGNFQKALDLYQKALDIEEKYLGLEHVSVANTKQNMGIVHGKKGDQGTAKQFYREAYKIYLRSLGADHPTTKGLAPFI